MMAVLFIIAKVLLLIALAIKCIIMIIICKYARQLQLMLIDAQIFLNKRIDDFRKPPRENPLRDWLMPVIKISLITFFDRFLLTRSTPFIIRAFAYVYSYSTYLKAFLSYFNLGLEFKKTFKAANSSS
jgi:hypothetical protein